MKITITVEHAGYVLKVSKVSEFLSEEKVRKLADQVATQVSHEVAAATVGVLVNPGPRKIQVIKLMRELYGLGLVQAKEMVDNCPVQLPSHSVDKPVILSRFAEIGATVEASS